MVRLAFFGVKPWEVQYLQQKLAPLSTALQVYFTETVLDKDHLPEDRSVELISVFVDSTIDAAVLAALPQLKFIATRSTGFDHIDLNAARQRGVAIASVPSYGENTVAEYTFALLLMLTRKMYEANHRVRESGQFRYEGLQGVDLKGRTIGVVGTGRIGCHVIRIAQGFGMQVVAYDPFPKADLAKERGFTYLPWKELLKVSDVVTLHVPYTTETHHLLNAESLALMKPSAYLINTSRGGVVDTAALAVALKENSLAGVGLDVLEEEGVIKDEMEFLAHGHPGEHNLTTVLAGHVLMDLPNAIVTPHNAFNTQEALERILDTTVTNITSYLQGQPTNLVP